MPTMNCSSSRRGMTTGGESLATASRQRTLCANSRVRAAWLGIPLLLVAEAALAQFRPLRFDDDFSAQRQSCAEDDDRIECWKDRPIADDVHMSIGGDLRWRYEHADN